MGGGGGAQVGRLPRPPTQVDPGVELLLIPEQLVPQPTNARGTKWLVPEGRVSLRRPCALTIAFQKIRVGDLLPEAG